MEAIREYLNNLFVRLPETPEILRAKATLLEMMEDKYEELIGEGKTEQEAVGIVISEFGNFEELAVELGIEEYLHKNQEETEQESKAGQAVPPRPVLQWGLAETKEFIGYARRHAWFVAVGVILCILAPFISSISDGAYDAGYLSELAADAISSSSFFIVIAAAVVLFCLASSMSKQYEKMKKKCIALDGSAEQYLAEERAKDETRRLAMRVTGVALCILSVVPSSINFISNRFWGEIVDSSVLLFVGAGVLLLVFSGGLGNRYEELEKAMKNAMSIGAYASYSQMNMAKNKKKMPAWVVVLLVIVGLFVCLVPLFMMVFGTVYYRTKSHVSTAVEESSTYDTSDISKIYVDLDFGNVRVETADVDKIEVDSTKNTERKISVVNKKGVMKISDSGKDVFPFSINGFKQDVTIRIPKDLALNYEVDVDAGNLTFKNVSGGKLVSDVDAGNVIIEDSHIAVLECDIDAGNFDYESTSPIEDYDMDLGVDLGNIVVNGDRVGNTYTVKNGSEYRIEVDVDAGNVKVSDAK